MQCLLSLIRRSRLEVGDHQPRATGTDLLGSLYMHECREFTLRGAGVHAGGPVAAGDVDRGERDDAEWQPRLRGAGAHANLVAVDGDSLANIGSLAADGFIVRGRTL